MLETILLIFACILGLLLTIIAFSGIKFYAIVTEKSADAKKLKFMTTCIGLALILVLLALMIIPSINTSQKVNPYIEEPKNDKSLYHR